MKDFVIVLLAVLVVWFSTSLVRVENQRYALWTGICGEEDPAYPQTLLDREDCLKNVETRTSALAHLAYALEIL